MTNPTAHGVSVFDGLVDAPSDLSAAIARVRERLSRHGDIPGALDAELTLVLAAAEQWNAYNERKQRVIAAGMGRSPLRDAAERAAAPVAWQPIATAPEGRVVLVFYKNQLGNGRTMRARYYLPETLESEQTESGWADEGWYEESEAYEYLMPLEHEPTHWMPMPAAPDAAAPAQAEPQPVSVPYELPAHAEPQPAPTPNPGPIGSSLGVAALDVAALVKRFGERARGANDNAQRGGDADAQVWSIVAQDYRDARAMLTAQQARIDALASSRDAAVRLWNEAGEEIEALKHDNGRMVEREEGLREALEAADGMRRGEDCPMCDAGTLRNPAKLHWDSCAFANYDIARAALARKEGE